MMDSVEIAALERDPIVIGVLESSYERRPSCWHDVSESEWESFEWQWCNRLSTAEDLERVLGLLPGEREAINRLQSVFPMVISPHMAAMIHRELSGACPIRMQAVPSLRELEVYEELSADPLGERSHGVGVCATRRYPDRVLLYTTHACAMRCRHCTRRSRVGMEESISDSALEEAITYAIHNEKIRDVLISGGDPMSLGNDVLERILSRLRSCSHIDVIRLCTRMVCTQPQRFFDESLHEMLKRYAPVYVNTQFNHPYEVSVESARALEMLRKSGCILGNQSVLLRGINDRAEILEPLYRWLLREGCRPYYLFVCDVAQGTHHFRTSIQTGLNIMKTLRGRLSGLAIPHYVVDLPDGMGKVDLSPDSIEKGCLGGHLGIRNWFGKLVDYGDLSDD